MAKKPSRRLVLLSSAAIAAVYVTGNLRTRAADAEASAASTLPPGSAPAATAPTATATASTLAARAPSSLVNAAPSAAGQAPAAAPAAAGSTTAYRDGTGTGISRFGNVEVAVTIQGGRITAATMTRVTTKYPASRIAGLPAQVVQRQSPNIDRVTGATYSARAFQDAVVQALSQAEGAGTTGAELAAAGQAGAVQLPSSGIAPSASQPAASPPLPGVTPIVPSESSRRGRRRDDFDDDHDDDDDD